MADVISTVVVQRAAADGAPDVVLRFLSPVRVVLVRTLRVYLQTVIGLVTTGAVAQQLVPAAQVLGSWQVAASLAVGPALVCAAQNTLELLARLDESAPQYRP